MMEEINYANALMLTKGNEERFFVALKSGETIFFKGPYENTNSIVQRIREHSKVSDLELITSDKSLFNTDLTEELNFRRKYFKEKGYKIKSLPESVLKELRAEYSNSTKKNYL